MDCNYVLITPAKNEEDNLPEVIECVLRQTQKPVLWIIVDDGSTDKTPNIVDNYCRSTSWMNTITLPPHPRDITYHYSFVCSEGFKYAVDACNASSLEFDYIALLDADTEIQPDFFEKLIGKMNDNPKLGITSGGIYHRIRDRIVFNGADEYLPAGTGRLWRKSCFFETGGYQIEPSPDSISNIKAVLRGWEIKQFDTIVAIERRETKTAEGYWKGFRIDGQTAYYFDKHPLLVLLGFVNFSVKSPFYPGLGYLFGYLQGLVGNGEKIRDSEIRDYYRNRRLRECLERVKS
jgi:glycosyltransferase involved in cell wall biosynthesis